MQGSRCNRVRFLPLAQKHIKACKERAFSGRNKKHYRRSTGKPELRHETHTNSVGIKGEKSQPQNCLPNYERGWITA